MGMANYACHADTVKPEFVQKICPAEYDEFMAALNDIGIAFDDFAPKVIHSDFDFNDTDEMKVKGLFEALCVAFEQATKTDGQGLGLTLEYHNPDDRDRGNELYGAAWSVYKVWVLSAAGMKYEDEITRVFWTTFG
jgi:hypothetical protein